MSSGKLIGTISSPDGSAINVCHTLLGGFQSALYTSSGIYIVQVLLDLLLCCCFVGLPPR